MKQVTKQNHILWTVRQFLVSRGPTKQILWEQNATYPKVNVRQKYLLRLKKPRVLFPTRNTVSLIVSTGISRHVSITLVEDRNLKTWQLYECCPLNDLMQEHLTSRSLPDNFYGCFWSKVMEWILRAFMRFYGITRNRQWGRKDDWLCWSGKIFLQWYYLIAKRLFVNAFPYLHLG